MTSQYEWKERHQQLLNEIAEFKSQRSRLCSEGKSVSWLDEKIKRWEDDAKTALDLATDRGY